ncbi:UDP-N-acetylmuramate:L-alanyl-gamma-D-glutamyl-meso-diaminopimelate ligase [Aliikangiella coralliicola]|uniref:UDP-N-acetylmuramate--L-alanyl-gamma-D-glutamyl-meso-2,6-diaminoheptandioate ligase n=1 Tax=Aliikangiella coralliicola TaxID=2592383 RepID=A0A545TWC5_9GAMM|nr:UDP-N-acetylmuramate:L-alanyl-gamma-D-glutamyl-meso-diaminopimelate ligase [Aliikangiella coralliicola]TQV81471.1 UDP-N-acetylmuramate:L-alanyl-gamma-D-glutamyl-meso-diaminopimelate ligase [Aliikangiella coralliicola]
MHIHILGICGTFMGGIARLAVEKGFKVTGSDRNCYPPMSDQLELLGITLHEGYDANQLKSEPDCVVVGNSMSRGVEVIEALLDSNQRYRSGPQWLNENILHDKWVIAAAGTHGKTSTASMITWILEANGYNPGFLIGGVMENFGVSARLTDSPFFVVEADEYDTAFFDKRSKFVHYRARTCILNNLEFDHADIFKDLEAIETQFHHLVRTVSGNGLIIRPFVSESLDRVIEKGCWSPVHSFALSKGNTTSEWSAKKVSQDGSHCEIYFKGENVGELRWELIGDHNVSNALAAISAAHHVGILPEHAIKSLASFKNVKRRMEVKGCVNDITVYDDFAHHPTAIKTTLQGLRDKVGKRRIIAVVDPRSNTMKMGFHKNTLVDAVSSADVSLFHMPKSFDWKFNFENIDNIIALESPELIIEKLRKLVQPGDSVLIMSNGGFGGIHDRLLKVLAGDVE